MEKSNVIKDNRDVELKQLTRRRKACELEKIARAYMDYIERHSKNRKENENHAV